jgi:hypothetical protein
MGWVSAEKAFAELSVIEEDFFRRRKQQYGVNRKIGIRQATLHPPLVNSDSTQELTILRRVARGITHGPHEARRRITNRELI